MNITRITSREIWNAHFNRLGSPSFLQSWEWGELQKKLGYDVERLGLTEKKEVKAVALVIKIRAKRGNFLFVPHGPVIDQQSSPKNSKDYLNAFLSYLKSLANQQHVDFIRIAPILIDSPENKQICADIGLKDAPVYMHAERIWSLDLSLPENQLLSSMRKTTRYLIRKAPKDGITIEKRTDKKSVEDFWNLYKLTAEREHFTPFSKTYIQNEFNEFHKTGNALFLFAKKNDEYLASALIDFTESTAFYHQGASIHTKYPAPYLLQWEAIREAKKRGCRFYNFWGILEPGRSPKNWEGLTLFKQGFGGFQTDYLTTQDYPMRFKYWFSYLYDLFLKWKRGV